MNALIASIDISQLLLGLYRRLEQLPPVTYRISPDARKLWNRWHEWCEEYKLSEPHPSIRSLYPKARERAARIALVLHVVEAVLTNRMPAPVVELDTIANAIAFVQWSINQTRILYAELGLTQHQDSNLILRLVERFQGQEIDAYRVRAWHSSIAKPSIQQCRDLMDKLVELGYASPNGMAGREYKITLFNLQNRSTGQTPFQSDFGGQKTGQFWSTLVKNFTLPKERDGKIDHLLTDFDHKIDHATRSQTTVDQLTRFSTNISISVGDKVRYVGRGEWGLFTVKGIWRNELTVEAIQDDRAVVSCPQWVTKQTIPLKDLRKLTSS
jgi:hypothetical protein